MILGAQAPGKVGHRQVNKGQTAKETTFYKVVSLAVNASELKPRGIIIETQAICIVVVVYLVNSELALFDSCFEVAVKA